MNAGMADDAHLIETRLDQTELFRGRFLHAFRDTVELPDGRAAVREYVVHPGAVMVIPLIEVEGETHVVLERQFRYPVGQVMTEFPAGKLDAGEDPWVCAQRELLEETGYRAKEWARVGRIHPVIAYSTEAIDVWFARGLVAGPRQLDAGEFLDVFTTPAHTLVAACLSGSVTDAKTVSGALWLQNVLAGAWPLTWQTIGT